MTIDATIAALLATLHDGIEVMNTILPPSHETEARVSTARLELGKTLGEGGMGIVRVARQAALGREVAVKTLRSEHAGRGFERRLLQEAWTTGTLEHPNIVPVYDIDLDEDGKPLIVLKRIEGRVWEELMHDPKAIGREDGASDPLEWNIRVLMQICRALQFAHRRGFVHRDLKPENVMVGSFGEVYVLDWGISVALSDDGTGRFPLAKDAQAMAGTPAYMAPEMLGGNDPQIGPWTDVYLLGAVLYEILMGHAPHEGEVLAEVLRSVLQGPAPVTGDPELRRICERAMDTDRSARFESVEQFRLALEGFLRHRGARQLAERADVSRQAMNEQLTAGDDGAADAAFAECRFGYRAAIQSWPDFEEAHERLREAELTMARADLAAGRPKAAARLLASHPTIPPELRAALDDALSAQNEERESVARLRDDVSEDVGHRTRSMVLALVCGLWILGPVIRESFYSENRWTAIIPSILSVTFVGGVLLWARESMRKTRINRTLAGLIGAVVVGTLCTNIIGVAAGLDIQTIDCLLPFVWLTGALVAVTTVHIAALPSAIAMGVACFVCLKYPEYRYKVSSLANAVVFINAVVMNRSFGLLRKTLEARLAAVDKR
ncbi:MAG: hypothetical protein ACI9KE_004338 [Polyangiales bacterium]|jgi:hypothetical protein